MSRNRIALCFLFLITALAANWIYLYGTVFLSGAGSVGFDSAGRYNWDVARYLGGWPLTYYVCCEYEDELSFVSFSVWRLLGNICLWSAALGLFLWYEAWAESKQPSAKQGKRRSITVGDLFVATLVIAMFFGYGQLLKNCAEANAALAESLRRSRARVGESAYLPVLLGNHLPEYVKRLFVRIDSVTLDHPETAQVQTVLDLPYLTALWLGGGDYDLRLLDAIPNKPLLNKLRVAGRPIDSQLIATIGSAKQLQFISLMRTNVTASALEGLGEMPALLSMDLTHTSVELPDPTLPVWASSVRQLLLPHPDKGRQAVFRIRGWPKLERLLCSEYDTGLNGSAVTMLLDDLPRLNEVTLDSMQLFDLDFDRLPELKSVMASSLQINQRLHAEQVAPTDVWVRHLSLGDVPLLPSLKVHGANLESFQIRNSRDLTFAITLDSEGNGQRFGSSYSFGQQNPSTQRIPLRIRQQWVDGLSNSVGPQSVDYAKLPLQDVDLSGLADNTRIRSLNLSNCNLSTQQMTSLLRLDNLQQLGLERQQMSGEMLNRLVAELPQLRRLTGAILGVDSVRIVGHQHIQQLDALRQMPASVHLEDLPNLAGSLSFPSGTRSIILKNLPKVVGVTLLPPVTTDLKMESLDSLRFFVGGGSTIKGNVARKVLNHSGLKVLTMAYCDLSADQLRSIGKLTDLTYLCLTGTQLNSQIVSDWEVLSKLETLRVDNTQIDGRAIAYLARLKCLRRLWIDSLAEPDLDRLAELDNLTYLSLPNSQLSVQGIRSLRKFKSLELLDLSDCSLDAKQLAALAESLPPKLKKLVLRNSSLDDSAFLKLSKSNTQLQFDLTNALLDDRLIDQLVLDNRAVSHFSSASQAARFRVTGGELGSSEIDPNLFDPANPPAATRNMPFGSSWGTLPGAPQLPSPVVP